MRRETGKTWVGVVLGAVLVAPLAACSGATTPPVATSSGATTSASPSEATIAALPPSVLTPLAGVTYTETAASRAAMASTRVAETVSAFSGAISRELVVGGKAVAGVQVYRFTPKIAAADHAWFVPMMLLTFTGAPSATSRIGGRTVEVVSQGTKGAATAYGWSQGDDVVILWAADPATAEKYAALYIRGSV